MKKIERVKTGIKGLDELISGGFPSGSSILITGTAGSGKSMLAMQYLYYGAKEHGERGLFISLEEEPERLIDDFSPILKDIEDLVKDKKIMIVKTELYKFDEAKSMIEDLIDKFKPTRVVVDPTTIVSLYFENVLQARRSLVELTEMLKKLGCTTLMTSESDERQPVTLGIEEFIVDAVVVLNCGIDVVGGKPRSLYVKKMRRTKHDLNTHPFEITTDGIKIVG